MTVLDAPVVAAPNRATPPRSRTALWAIPPLLVVLLIALYPLLRVFGEAVGVGTWTEVLGTAVFRDALWRTVAIAVTSTIGCLILGSFLAIVLAFVPFSGSQLVGRLIDTVLSLPSFLITLAFTFLYGTAGAVNAAILGLTGGHEPGPIPRTPGNRRSAQRALLLAAEVHELNAPVPLVRRD